MQLYHGTVKAFLPDIMKEGLKPDSQHAWRIIWPSGHKLRTSEKTDSIFLTPDKDTAEHYAKSKTAYFKTAPGHKFQFYDEEFTKEPSAPVLHTTPVLLVITLPETAHLLPDPREDEGYKLHGTIQPEFIKPEDLPEDL